MGLGTAYVWGSIISAILIERRAYFGSANMVHWGRKSQVVPTHILGVGAVGVAWKILSRCWSGGHCETTTT
jgi:hypothetical protein